MLPMIEMLQNFYILCKLPTVEHHRHVNNLHVDPEKASSMGLGAGAFSVGNIMRINPLDKRMWPHLGQHVYFVVYMMFYGIFNFIFSITYSVTGQGTLKISKALRDRFRIRGLLVNLLLIIRFGLLPWYLTGTPLILLEVKDSQKIYPKTYQVIVIPSHRLSGCLSAMVFIRDSGQSSFTVSRGFTSPQTKPRNRMQRKIPFCTSR